MKSRFKKRKRRYEEGGPVTQPIDRKGIHPILTDEQTLDYQDYLISLHELDFPGYKTDPKGNQMSPASLNPGDDIRYNMNDRPGDIDKHKGIDRKNYFRNIYRNKDQHRWTPSDERDWQKKFPRNQSDEYAQGGEIFPALKSSVNRARNEGQFDVNSSYYSNQLNDPNRLATGEAGTPWLDPIDLVSGATGAKLATRVPKVAGKTLEGKQASQYLQQQMADKAEREMLEMDSYRTYNPDKSYGPNVLKTRSLPMDYGFNRSKIDNFKVMEKTNKGPYGGGTQYSSRMNLSPPGTVYADDALNKDMWDRIIMTPSKNKRGGLVGPRKYDSGGWLNKAWSGVKNSALFGLDNSLAAIGMPNVIQNQPEGGGNKSFFSYTDDSVGRQYQKADAGSNAFSGLVGKAVATYYGGPAAGAAISAVQPIQEKATNQNRDIQPSMNDQQVSQGIDTLGNTALNMYGTYSGGQGKSTQFSAMSTGQEGDMIKSSDGTLYNNDYSYAKDGGEIPIKAIVEKGEGLVNGFTGKTIRSFTNFKPHNDGGRDPVSNYISFTPQEIESQKPIVIPKTENVGVTWKKYQTLDKLYRQTALINLLNDQNKREDQIDAPELGGYFKRKSA